MKKYLFILILIIASCSNGKDKNKFDNNDQTKENEKIEYDLLRFDNEKVTLLSLSKNLSQKQIVKILTEYDDMTFANFDSIEDPDFYKNIIDSIALNNNMNSQNVASIIFSFKYELVTNEEVIEEYETERQDYIDEKNDYESEP
ncbi:MAG: hypothetical protein ACOVLC_15175 [Flavobacterium sp.]